jgi:hypothetical protein
MPRVAITQFAPTFGNSSSTYIADPNNADVTLAAALSANNILFMRNGTYTFGSAYVLPTGDKTILGQPGDRPVLTGNTTDYNLIKTLKSGTSKTIYSNITIKGLKFKSNYGSCLVINNTDGVTIEDCEFTFTVTTPIRQGLFTQHCKNVSIKNNYAHDYTGNGLSVTATDNFTIQGNMINGGSNSDDGIDVDFDFLDTSSIPSNTGSVTGNVVKTITIGNGIRIENSNHVTTSNNVVSGVSTGAGLSGGILVNCSSTNAGTDHTVSGNVVSNCASGGVVIDGTNLTACTVQNNTVSSCGANSGTNPRGGIILGAPSVTCTGNIVDATLKSGNDGAGILIYKKDGHTVTGNTVTNSINGIQAWNGDGNQNYVALTVNNNTFNGNTNNTVNIP